MINLSSRLSELFNQPTLNTFLCLKIEDHPNTLAEGLMLTTYPRNITIKDDFYLSNEFVFEVEAPKMVSTVNRDLYKIQLIDSGGDLTDKLNSNLNGTKVIVQLCFIDYYTELPETDEVFTIYKGVIDNVSLKVDTDLIGERIITISCSNLMASLDTIDAFYTSKDAVEQHSPGDSSYDQVYQGSGSVNLAWGRFK